MMIVIMKSFVSFQVQRFSAFSAFFRLPLLVVLALLVGEQLVSHPAENVGGGLRGDDDRLEGSGRDLSQDAAHSARHAFLLVLSEGHFDNVLSSVLQALQKFKAKASK